MTDFEFAHLCGWDETKVEMALALAPENTKRPFQLIGQGPKSRRIAFFEIVRRVIGKDPENIPQEIGDCCPVGTQITMRNGVTKNIEDIQVGEYVLTHRNKVKRVTDTIKKKYTGRLVTVDAEGHYKSLTTTDNHQYVSYSNQSPYEYEWVDAKDLELDIHNILIPFGFQEVDYQNYDRGKSKHVRFSDLGLIRPIDDISYEEVENIDVYCLEVEDDHSFIANGYAVHNCVSWGYKHGIEDLQCYQIAMGNMSQFRLIFPSYHYGTGKVYIGGQGGWSRDGSFGSWQSEALTKYGLICVDDPGVPPYSGSVARDYGHNAGGVLDKLSPLGKQHLVKGTSLVTTWDQLVDALTNGYPVPVCSNQGFNMMASNDGFHAPRGVWGHCMEICYVDDDGGNIEPHVGIKNSWGDVHGQIIDFRDPTLKWPVGMLRVRKNVVVNMLAAQDSYAISSLEDFPAQTLPIDFFRQW